MNRINIFFRPKSMAVIGAGRQAGSIGHTFLSSILAMGFKGEIYPVNPKADIIEGLRCYQKISELPGEVEVAALLLPYQLVPEAIEELVRKGIKNIIVVSAGFKEIGGAGVEREKQLRQMVRRHGLNMLGPNCMGLFNSDPQVRLNASFSAAPPLPGGVAFISQSGALGVGAVDMSRRHQMGFSSFISLGNKTDIDEVDALDFMGDDDASRVIMLYLEDIARPTDFRRVCRAAVRKKPVLVVKSGRGETARRAAFSHTGALAEADTVVDSFLKQCGAIRCKNMEEMLDTALCMSVMPCRIIERIVIISNGGGPAILTADALEAIGCTLPELTRSGQEVLRKILPAEAAVVNPVDMIASADHNTYRQVFDIVDQEPEIDAIVVVFVQPPVPTDPAHIIEALAPAIRNTSKAVLAVLMIDRSDKSGVPIYRSLGVPVYSFPNELAHSVANMQQYINIRQRRQSNLPPDMPLASSSSKQTGTVSQAVRQIGLQQVFDYLQEYQLPLAPYLITDDVEEAVRFCRALGQPIVVKIANEEVIHKSDSGLVKLDLSQPDQVRAAFHEIAEKSVFFLPKDVKPVILIQKMIRGFPELVVGLKRDPVFGPVVMTGLGGTLVEAIGDVAFGVVPLDETDAYDMLNELRLRKLLEGIRQYPAVDISKLVQLILRVSQMALDKPEIQEMDLNPIIWSAEQASPVIVDARMMFLTN